MYHSDDEAARWRLTDLEREHDRMLAEWERLAERLDWSARRRRRQREAMWQRRLCEGADLARQIDQAEVAIEELRLVNAAFEDAVARGPEREVGIGVKAAVVVGSIGVAMAMVAWPILVGYGITALVIGGAGTLTYTEASRRIRDRRARRALAAGNPSETPDAG
jgi:hypothetical protein